MFKSLWNYFKGYVIIEITGFSIERFLNLSLHKGINISDLTETKNGVICKIKIKDFKKLKSISKKTGCKFKISSKHGIPFFIFKNRKKKVYLIGSFIFIMLIYFMSSFIWAIEIKGNNTVDNNKILAFCENNGFNIGSYKHKLNPKKLQQEIKNNFPELSWVNVNIKGTLATIKVSENIIIENTEQNLQPCDIVAEQDGIITSIVTRNGTPLVKENDAFKSGDILVSGELLIKEGEELKDILLTHSDADIKGKIETEIKVLVNLKYENKSYTKKCKKEYYLLAFNNLFSLNLINPKISYTNYDKIIERKQVKLTKNFPLPFIFITKKYIEYNNEINLYSIEEAKAKANKLIFEEIIKSVDFSSDILENKIEFEEFDDKIIATAKIKMIKNIGQKLPVQIKNKLERNTSENGTSKTSDTQ